MLYDAFRTLELDGFMVFLILMVALYKIFLTKWDSRSAITFFGAGSILFIVVFYGSYLLPFVSWPHAYWVFFLTIFLVSLVSSHFLLPGNIYEKFTYILFYVTFVQLYKMVCSPLYEMEGKLQPERYRFYDIATNILMEVFMIGFAVMLCRAPLKLSKKLMRPGYFAILYFPLALLLYYGFKLSGGYITYIFGDALIALIMLPMVPVLYQIFVYSLRSFEEQKKLDHALTETQAQIFRYRYSLEIEEKIKKERHEIKNNYLYIRSLLDEERYDELKLYLDENVGEKMQKISSVSTGNTMIDYIINRKIAEAEKKHIRIYTEILLPENLSVDEDKFSTIFLNIFNNALEACEDVELPDIHISLKCIKNYLCCEISNKADVDKLMKNPLLQTTKRNKSEHGLGLKIVRDTIEESNGIFQSSIEGNYFHAKFMLPERS